MSRKLEHLIKDLTQLTFFLEDGPVPAQSFLERLLHTIAFSFREQLRIWHENEQDIFNFPVSLKDQKNIFQVVMTLKRRHLDNDEVKYTQWRDKALGYMLVSLGYSLSEAAFFLEMQKVHVIESFYQLIPRRETEIERAVGLEIAPDRQALMAKAKAIFLATFASDRESTTYSMPGFEEIREQFSSKISVNFIMQAKKQFLTLLDQETKANR